MRCAGFVRAGAKHALLQACAPKPLSARTVGKRTRTAEGVLSIRDGSASTGSFRRAVLKSPVGPTPRPLTLEEMSRIYDACMTVNLTMGTHEETGAITNEELLTLHASPLQRPANGYARCSQTVGEELCTRKRLRRVYVPLPPFLCDELNQVRIRHLKFFFKH